VETEGVEPSSQCLQGIVAANGTCAPKTIEERWCLGLISLSAGGKRSTKLHQADLALSSPSCFFVDRSCSRQKKENQITSLPEEMVGTGGFEPPLFVIPNHVPCQARRCPDGAPGQNRTVVRSLRDCWSATDLQERGGTERTRTVIVLVDNQVPHLSATIPKNW
jgi:hypothetical protein